MEPSPLCVRIEGLLDELQVQKDYYEFSIRIAHIQGLLEAAQMLEAVEIDQLQIYVERCSGMLALVEMGMMVKKGRKKKSKGKG